jgi:DNA polymerase IV
MNRKILHCDMDCFYAAIEQRDHPEYRGKPVIVGGDPQQRGVVATASYEARAYRIQSAMPAKTAQRLCPHAIFLRPRFEVYREVSQTIMDIFRSYSEMVEPVSLDEAYVDVTTNTHAMESATVLARDLKEQVHAQTGLTVSVGVSSTKFVAKLASDYAKPDGLTVVTPQQAEQFLAALPVSKFFGVGKVTAAKLEAQGIRTGADLRQLTEDHLYTLFGKHGVHLYHFVRAQDDRPVEPARIRKSIGKETTLREDTSDCEEMLRILEQLTIQVEMRLKELKTYGKALTLKIKFADFEQMTRTLTLAYPLQNAQVMMPSLRFLLLTHLEGSKKPVRLVGVTVSALVDQGEIRQPGASQVLSLWD